MRFPGFTDEWKKVTFNEVVTLQRGSSPRPIINFITHDDSGVNWVRIGDMPDTGRLVTQTEEKITVEGALKSRHVNIGDLILSNSMSFGQPYIMGIDGYIHDGWFVLKNFEKYIERDFLCNLLIAPIIQKQYSKLAAGGVVQNISSELVNSVKFSIPPLSEQKKIVSLLNSIDERIEIQNKIIEDLKKLKSVIRKKLFANLKNLPTEYIEIGELLNYEQPSEYIVASDEYISDITKIPVLTANKGFILGYTEEQFGVYSKGDCIIFDDFTMDAKYVTFPFKVKSSAIKILTAKSNVNLRFMFEYLQSMDLKSEEHKRHYISEIATLVVAIPMIEIQNHIACIIGSIDRKLAIEQQIAKEYELEKLYFLSNIFI